MYFYLYVFEFELAGRGGSNSLQHNAVHRNLLPWPPPPEDPRLSQVPSIFPGLF